MNKLVLSAISALGCLSMATKTAEAKVVWQFRSDGAFASFDANSSETRDSEHLYVTKGGTPQAPETYLTYYWSDCDWETGLCQGVNAYGKIPNHDFTASGKSATLNTNTAGNPDFSASAWSYNNYTGEYSEVPTTLGAFNLSWSAGTYSYKLTGTKSETNLNTSWKSTGQSVYSSATASGTIGGQTIQPSYGYIGINSNTERHMER